MSFPSGRRLTVSVMLRRALPSTTAAMGASKRLAVHGGSFKWCQHRTFFFPTTALCNGVHSSPIRRCPSSSNTTMGCVCAGCGASFETATALTIHEYHCTRRRLPQDCAPQRSTNESTKAKVETYDGLERGECEPYLVPEWDYDAPTTGKEKSAFQQQSAHLQTPTWDAYNADYFRRKASNLQLDYDALLKQFNQEYGRRLSLEARLQQAGDNTIDFVKKQETALRRQLEEAKEAEQRALQQLAQVKAKAFINGKGELNARCELNSNVQKLKEQLHDAKSTEAKALQQIAELNAKVQELTQELRSLQKLQKPRAKTPHPDLSWSKTTISTPEPYYYQRRCSCHGLSFLRCIAWGAWRLLKIIVLTGMVLTLGTLISGVLAMAAACLWYTPQPYCCVEPHGAFEYDDMITPCSGRGKKESPKAKIEPMVVDNQKDLTRGTVVESIESCPVPSHAPSIPSQAQCSLAAQSTDAPREEKPVPVQPMAKDANVRVIVHPKPVTHNVPINVPTKSKSSSATEPQAAPVPRTTAAPQPQTQLKEDLPSQGAESNSSSSSAAVETKKKADGWTVTQAVHAALLLGVAAWSLNIGH